MNIYIEFWAFKVKCTQYEICGQVALKNAKGVFVFLFVLLACFFIFYFFGVYGFVLVGLSGVSDREHWPYHPLPMMGSWLGRMGPTQLA